MLLIAKVFCLACELAEIILAGLTWDISVLFCTLAFFAMLGKCPHGDLHRYRRAQSQTRPTAWSHFQAQVPKTLTSPRSLADQTDAARLHIEDREDESRHCVGSVVDPARLPCFVVLRKTRNCSSPWNSCMRIGCRELDGDA